MVERSEQEAVDSYQGKYTMERYKNSWIDIQQPPRHCIVPLRETSDA